MKDDWRNELKLYIFGAILGIIGCVFGALILDTTTPKRIVNKGFFLHKNTLYIVHPASDNMKEFERMAKEKEKK